MLICSYIYTIRKLNIYTIWKGVRVLCKDGLHERRGHGERCPFFIFENIFFKRFPNCRATIKNWILKNIVWKRTFKNKKGDTVLSRGGGVHWIFRCVPLQCLKYNMLTTWCDLVYHLILIVLHIHLQTIDDYKRPIRSTWIYYKVSKVSTSPFPAA